MIAKLSIPYDLNMYDFVNAARRLMGLRYLEDAHIYLDDNPLLERENDQNTIFHDLFYRRWVGSPFSEVYLDFIEDFVSGVVGESFAYQTVPTFRVQFPNNVSVGEFHRDRDYGHSTDEINFWLPLTDVTKDNTIWIQSNEESELTPFVVQVGRVGIFDTSNLLHGNRVSESEKTRMSIDFRVIPESVYCPSEKTSINTKKRFVVGDYFSWYER
jgi:hypothetical protein